MTFVAEQHIVICNLSFYIVWSLVMILTIVISPGAENTIGMVTITLAKNLKKKLHTLIIAKKCSLNAEKMHDKRQERKGLQ